jgi:hypothetical protein
MGDKKETTTPFAGRGPTARKRGPHIVTKPQNTRQKDESRIRSNVVETSSLKKKGL